MRKSTQLNPVEQQFPAGASQRFFLELADSLRDLIDPYEIAMIGTEKLGKYLGVNQVCYAEIDNSGFQASISQEWNDGSMSSKIGTHMLMDFGPAFVADLKNGDSVIINDVLSDPRTSQHHAVHTFNKHSIRSFINIPLINEGVLTVVLAIHCTQPRHWTDDDVFAAQETAARTWSALLRAHTEMQLRQSHDTYLSLIENNPMGVYLIDQDFRLVQFSKGAIKVFSGIDQPLGQDFEKIIHILWPEPFATEVIGHFRNTLETGDFYQSPNTTEKRADIDTVESYDWQIERVVLRGGKFGVVCYFYDMTKRHSHEEHIKSLMNELNHRSKNTLSVINSIARQTASNDKDEFLKRFGDRIQALAATQDILVKSEWKSADVAELVIGQLSYMKDLIGNRITLCGASTIINTTASESISLAIHELSTNSMKYGALSNQQGTVEISWNIENHASDKSLFRITWTESLGPKVVPPTRKGFGSTVIVTMAKRSVNGEVELEYRPEGLFWRLQCPAKNVLSVDSL